MLAISGQLCRPLIRGSRMGKLISGLLLRLIPLGMISRVAITDGG